jgi:outer membrane protein assembly factor BamB
MNTRARTSGHLGSAPFLALLGFGAVLFMPRIAASQSKPVGWHGDSGFYSGTSIPSNWWEAKNTVWSRAIAKAGNGSPVVAGNLVIVNSEPTQVRAMDRRNGAVRWKTEILAMDALPKAERKKVRRQLQKLRSTEKKLDKIQHKLYRLMRKTRSGDATEADLAKTASLQKKQNALMIRVTQTAQYGAPQPFEFIGYSSATPLVHKKRIFVVMGTGVVAALNLKGKRLWTRKVSEQPKGMQGYQRGNAASPLWVNGLLIVSLDHVYGINPDDGTIVWTGPKFTDFGTPAVMKLAGGHVLITANGAVIDAKTGNVLRERVDRVWYNGPVVDGDIVYFLGSDAPAEGPILTKGHARALRLSWDGRGALHTNRLWDVTLRTDRYYGTPIVHGGFLYGVSRRGTMYAIRTENGEIVFEADLKKSAYTDFYSSPVLTDGRLFVIESHGWLHEVQVRPEHKVLNSHAGSHKLYGGPKEVRASPFVMGSEVYLYTRSHLNRVQKRKR